MELADLLRNLGDVPAERVLMFPRPGTATARVCGRSIVSGGGRSNWSAARSSRRALHWRDSGLLTWLGYHVMRRMLGDRSGGVLVWGVPFRVAPDTILIPDMLWVPREPPPEQNDIVEGAPALVCECVNDRNTPGETARKLHAYFAAGTRLAWIVEPDTRSVAVWTSPTCSETLTGDAVLTGRDLLPGFAMSLPDLFDGPPRPAGV